MSATVTMTLDLPNEINEHLEQLARETQRSKSDLVAEAIAIYVDYELKIVNDIKQGLKDAEEGNFVDHEDAMEEMKAALANTQPKRA